MDDIKVISEDRTYYEENTVFVLEYKGRKIKVSKYVKADSEFNDYQNETTIEEEKIKDLTDEEKDEIHDFVEDEL